MQPSSAAPCLFGGLLSLTAIACDDPTPPALGYDPQETVEALVEVAEVFLVDPHSFFGLGLAADALSQFAAEPAASLPAVEAYPALLRDLANRREWLITSDDTWSLLRFPDSAVGKTFVWDLECDCYAADESRTGAPPDGVRFDYYELIPIATVPVVPLVELGFIDLTDLDVEGEDRLGIRVVDASGASDYERLLYIIGLTGTAEPADGSAHLTLAGSVSDGVRTIDFSLSHASTRSEAADSKTGSMQYEYVNGSTIRYDIEASSAFEAEAWEELDLRVEVVQETRTVVFAVVVAPDGRLTGEIQVDGTRVTEIGGVDGGPTFTRSDGGSLTSAQRSVLRDLWYYVGALLDLTQGLFFPVSILLLPG